MAIPKTPTPTFFIYNGALCVDLLWFNVYGNVEIWVVNLFMRLRGEDSNYNFIQIITAYNPEIKKS